MTQTTRDEQNSMPPVTKKPENVFDDVELAGGRVHTPGSSVESEMEWKPGVGGSLGTGRHGDGDEVPQPVRFCKSHWKVLLCGTISLIVCVCVVVAVLVASSDDDELTTPPPYQEIANSFNLSPDSSNESIDAAITQMNTYFSESCKAGSVFAVTRNGDRTIVSNGVTKISDDADPVNSDTLFEIGSISKPFTGLELARQIVAGVLTLETPLNDLLPDFIPELRVNGELVTMRKLVTHTAGFPRMPKYVRDQTLDLYEFDPDQDFMTEEDLLREIRIAAEEGLFNTGVADYSNFGFVILGYALGRNAGTTYPDLQKANTDLMGMNSTWIHSVPEEALARLSTGYLPGPKRAPYWYDGNFFVDGAGSTLTSMNDLLLFVETLMSPDKILGGDQQNDETRTIIEAIELSLTPLLVPSNPDAPGHAFSWFYDYPNETDSRTIVFDHSGGTAGFSSYAVFQPKSKTAIVGMTNCGFMEHADIVRIPAALSPKLFEH